jgi:nitric oxide reductase subunit B
MAEGNGHTTGNGHTENGHTMVTDLGAVGFRNSLAHFLMTKKNWWLVFAVVAAISTVGLVLLGKWTYEGKPPLANFVSASSGETVITKDQILDGKEVFHLRGLMSWGSFFGDGSERGPDFTADALHRTRLAMGEYYKNQGLDPDAIETRVKRELHENGWDSEAGVIRINDAQVYAIEVLNEHYTRMFTDETYPQAFGVMDAITEPEEIQGLTSFFFWGGWTAAADRPGQTYSYTHNWPYEPESGNIMTSQTVIWSFAAILGLFAAIMLVLYVYGQLKTLNQDPFVLDAATLTTEELEQGYGAVRPTQGAAYKFFAFAMILFAVQVFAGILSAEDFIGGEGPASATINFLGITLPYTVVRA